MLIQAIAQLRRGMTWLARQPFDGEAGTIVKAVVQQLREVERLAGLPAMTVDSPPAAETPAPRSGSELLARGRAFLRRREDIPEPPTRPGTGSLPRPEDAERSLQKWAKGADTGSTTSGSPPDPGGNGHPREGGGSAGPWPPPLPSDS
jgi:hypothetical protein